MAAERPTGTVTFLFSDIEGSTRWWEEHPEEMAASLERHDEVVREAIARHGGYVFATGGDGFAAAFAAAGDAVRAGVEALVALSAEGGPLRLGVRVGVHTGEAAERDGDYFGSAVNRAARLMSIAHGGQLLVSDAAEPIVRDAVSLQPLGEHRLRDLGRPMAVFQVMADDLRSEFPPLRSLDTFAGNLPEQVSSFIGRKDELSDLRARVGEHRLVTVIGVGGTGKTRLALQVAADLLGDFDDGSWFVELGLVQSDDAVPEAVMTAMGLRTQPGHTIEHSLTQHLRDRTALLVIDNCEHVIDGAAGLVESLLRTSSLLHIVVTSREALGVPGEQIMPLRPLRVSEEHGTSDAAALLVERVRSERGEFTPTESEREAIATICRQLDGMPLAIELAASRCRAMGVREVADRLDQRFRLLTGGRRGGVERHRTLQAALDWSYQLLDPLERDVFDRLGVFVGDFETGDALAVAGDDEGRDEFEVLDALASLVDKSMCVANLNSEPARYRYLETMRAYARGHLEAADALGLQRGRHAARYADVAHAARRALVGPDEREAHRGLDHRWADIRSALEWAVETGDRDVAEAIAALVVGLAPRGAFAAAAWFYELRDATAEWPHAQDAAAVGAFMAAADNDAVRSITERTTATRDRPEEALVCRFYSGLAALTEGDLVGMLGSMERLYAAGHDAPDPFSRMIALWGLAIGRAMAGLDPEDTVQRIIELGEAHEWSTAVAMGLYADGRANETRDPERSMERYERALSVARDVENEQVELIAWRELVGLQLLHGAPSEVAPSIVGLLRHAQTASNEIDQLLTLSHAMRLLTEQHHHAEAATVHAWLEGRYRGSQAEQAAIDAAAATIDSVLGDAAIERDRARAMGTREIIDYTCEALSAFVEPV